MVIKAISPGLMPFSCSVEMFGAEGDIKAMSPNLTSLLASPVVLKERLLWTFSLSRENLFLLVIPEKDQVLPFSSLLALISFLP